MQQFQMLNWLCNITLYYITLHINEVRMSVLYSLLKLWVILIFLHCCWIPNSINFISGLVPSSESDFIITIDMMLMSRVSPVVPNSSCFCLLLVEINYNFTFNMSFRLHFQGRTVFFPPLIYVLLLHTVGLYSA
jgi:hypothetical protein